MVCDLGDDKGLGLGSRGWFVVVPKGLHGLHVLGWLLQRNLCACTCGRENGAAPMILLAPRSYPQP